MKNLIDVGSQQKQKKLMLLRWNYVISSSTVVDLPKKKYQSILKTILNRLINLLEKKIFKKLKSF